MTSRDEEELYLHIIIIFYIFTVSRKGLGLNTKLVEMVEKRSQCNAVNYQLAQTLPD